MAHCLLRVPAAAAVAVAVDDDRQAAAGGGDGVAAQVRHGHVVAALELEALLVDLPAWGQVMGGSFGALLLAAMPRSLGGLPRHSIP